MPLINGASKDHLESQSGGPRFEDKKEANDIAAFASNERWPQRSIPTWWFEGTKSQWKQTENK